jgi:hypothetical protein
MDFDNPHTPEAQLPPAPYSIISYELVPGDSRLDSDPYILAVDQGGSLWLCFHLRGTQGRHGLTPSPNWQRLN